MMDIPSPAVAIVGRHNSGKTTLMEKLISELTARGLDVGSVKHHSREGFEIDYPGKDSYRHRAAGATETVIAAPGQVACVKTVEGELECADIVRRMPGHDIVLVEGYRKSGLPTVEVMRAGNPSDARAAEVFAEGARRGWPLDADFTQLAREASLPDGSLGESRGEEGFSPEKLPAVATVAVVTDIPKAREAAYTYGIPAFGLEAIAPLADFLQERFARRRITVAIQAGGESKRMGQSKATVPFAGRPLICRLVERLAPAADEVLVTTNEPESLVFLRDDFPDLDIRLVRDAFDERGALPGLYTALSAASCPHVAVVACDMVFASPSLALAESLAATESGADAVVPVNRHGFEPFHALYLPSRCLPAIEAALGRGELRAQSFFGDVELYEFSREEVMAAEPRGGCFLNANTPEDLRAFERMAAEE